MIDQPTYADVMRLIELGGLGTVGADLFGGEWGPVDAQALILEGPGIVSPLKTLYENPSVQILVRGPKNGDPASRDIDVYQRAKTISNFLLSQPECVEINGRSYKGFEPLSNIVPLGKDSNERFTYSMNFYTFRNF